jgi:hypothetical protein
MSVSARLNPKTRTALTRYCKNLGVTKTQAIERGIHLLLRDSQDAKHSAYLAFERLRERLPRGTVTRDERSGSAALKRHLDAKYPA